MMDNQHIEDPELIPEDRSEAGFTIIELVTAVVIFTVFTVMFLGAMVSLLQGTTRAQTTAESATGLLTVFQTLDRQVRYADAINKPGPGASGAMYIEFRIPATSAPSGETTCTQWRHDPDRSIIEVRQWPDLSGATPTPWRVQLTNVRNEAGDYPFQMHAASNTGSARQQLEIRLSAGHVDETKGGSEMETRFVARNSSTGSQSNAIAPDGQSVTPVCLATGGRP